jgi:hypothetical protein
MFPLLLLAGLGAFVVLSRSGKGGKQSEQSSGQSAAERALTESATDSGITLGSTSTAQQTAPVDYQSPANFFPVTDQTATSPDLAGSGFKGSYDSRALINRFGGSVDLSTKPPCYDAVKDLGAASFRYATALYAGRNIRDVLLAALSDPKVSNGKLLEIIAEIDREIIGSRDVKLAESYVDRLMLAGRCLRETREKKFGPMPA